MMNKINIRLSLLFFGLIINTAVIASSSATIEADLMYNNKPINPLCFNQGEGADKKISLTNTCGVESIVVVGRDKDLIKKGYYGFDYKEKLIKRGC